MDQACSRGLFLYERRRYAEAADEFRRATATGASAVLPRAMLGLSLAMAGDRAAGEAVVADAIREGPGRSFGHYAMACIILRPLPGRGRWAAYLPWRVRRRCRDARDHVRRALAIDPHSAEYLAVLAQIELCLNDNPAAEAAARRGLAADPAHAGCGTALAKALTRGGRSGEARQVIGRVLERHPLDAAAHLASGSLSLDEGRPGPAMAEVGESLRLDPTRPLARAVARQARWEQMPVVATVVGFFRRAAHNQTTLADRLLVGLPAGVIAMAAMHAVRLTRPLPTAATVALGVVGLSIGSAIVVVRGRRRRRQWARRQDARQIEAVE